MACTCGSGVLRSGGGSPSWTLPEAFRTGAPVEAPMAGVPRTQPSSSSSGLGFWLLVGLVVWLFSRNG